MHTLLCVSLRSVHYVHLLLINFCFRKKTERSETYVVRAWKDLLFEYSNEHKKVPMNKINYKNQNIGQWLQDQKKKIKSNTDNVYINLSKNKYVKQSLDKYLAKKV